jgi:hypothetical protein
MTDRVCARPGCGCEITIHDAKGCRGPRYFVNATRSRLSHACSCPSYRTQEQQEAWERAAELADLDLAQMYPIDLVVLFNRLCELYP